jgi:hypothetical protein
MVGRRSSEPYYVSKVYVVAAKANLQLEPTFDDALLEADASSLEELRVGARVSCETCKNERRSCKISPRSSSSLTHQLVLQEKRLEGIAASLNTIVKNSKVPYEGNRPMAVVTSKTRF